MVRYSFAAVGGLLAALILVPATPAAAQAASAQVAVESSAATPQQPVAAQPAGPSNADLAARIQAVEEVVRKQKELIDLQQRQIEELKTQGAKSSDTVSELEGKWQKAQQEKKAEVPGWLQGLKFSGDLRLRYEGIWSEPRKAKEDNLQHGRFRLRFGVEKKITDDLDAAFRLASGKDNDATSTEQTLTDDFAKKPVWIDLAYMAYHPTAVPGLVVSAGKFKNPYVNTDMVWDPDLNPEGAYESYKFKAGETVEPFITLGQNFLAENTSGPDATLLAYQPGANFYFGRNVTWTTALAYYDFMNIERKGNFRTNSKGSTFGNTAAADGSLAAEEFNVVNFTNVLKVKAGKIPVSPYFDYAKNVGDEARVNGSKEDTAWAAGVKVNDVKEKGDWAVEYKYARIEADSIVGGFSDSSFGFANRKGHKLGVAYGIAKNTTIAVAAYFTKPVTGAEPDKTTLQADLVFKF